jgi:uncharacterized hydrophobic protein (TIGR00271 family)
MSKLGLLLHGGPIDCTEIARVREILMFEEPKRQDRLVRFWTLLVLASAIATYGLLADSVATVIGAMIVAPLMLPIMGLAFGISIGDRRAILSSLLVALGGIATSVLVGYLLSIPFGHLDPASNAQVISRTAPKLVDLMAALATGFAGAFAISRKDVSDTLPGVAIAISLVPPLANAGILLGVGRPDLAWGSMLLFLTNYLAILLTGAFMFGLVGFSQAAFSVAAPGTRRTALLIVLVLALAIVVPLASTSYSVAVNTFAEQHTAEAARNWLAGSGYRFVSATAEDDVRLVVAGAGELPSIDALKESLQGRLYGKVVSLEVVPETLSTFETQ